MNCKCYSGYVKENKRPYVRALYFIDSEEDPIVLFSARDIETLGSMAREIL